ncbi:Tyrosine-protein kinase Wzc [Dissulfuribacter thermophilus]|uniref:non-specific protein-tyrosine kinase n=1 Tax=Dissulfuribacter thermophilus TaxID=1156395 RepID=A0A1B9F6V0_9BACT|nr:polysaccharide biosynthesis tyrosine autokinase [Dissulfuribacter thermophilus]OCC15636.1 Tyrosine-protein kinase Wzc [Dissulfuribacter thermophilus]
MEVQQINEQEIHLRDYIRVLKKRKKIIITFATITIAVVVLATLAATPYYKASVQVLIERNYDAELMGRMYIPYDPEFLETQFNIIKSRNVIDRVVKKLKLDTAYRQHFFKEEQRSFLAPVVSWIKDTIKSVMPSKKGTAQDEEDISLEAQVKPPSDADIIAKIIQSRLSAKPVPNTKIVTISYMDENPVLASLIVNTIAEAYMDEMLDIKMNASRYSIKWMTLKAEEEKKKLEASERALQAYTREHDIVTVEDRLAVIPQKLQEFSTQLSKAQAKRKELEEVYRQIQQAGNDTAALEALPIFSENKTLQSLRDQILKADQHIAELSKKYGPKHPLMIKAVEDREVLLREKQKELQRIVHSTEMNYKLAKSTEENLKDLLEQTKQELINLKDRMIQYDILKREADTNRALYDALIKRIKQQSASEQTQTVNIWVVKKAEVPVAPATPKKKRNLLLAVVLGLFGGIGMAFFVEYLDNTVKSVEEVEQKTGLPVLTVVADVKEKHESIDRQVLEHPRGPIAESFRALRSQLMLSSAEHPPRSILISSAVEGEGKTALVVNLATTLSEANRSVLAIDCDLRKPRLHKAFNLVNDKGLSSYLVGEAGEQDVIVNLSEPKIDVMTSGPIPPNPAELLASNRMEELVTRMKDKYDFVLFDSSPILSATDSQILSRLAEGTILVIRAGETTFEQLQGALRLFRSVNANILGIVLNGVDLGKNEQYYYHGYYSYYGSE